MATEKFCNFFYSVPFFRTGTDEGSEGGRADGLKKMSIEN